MVFQLKLYLATLAAALLVGCAPTEHETPAQGLEAIIRLHEARDFETLVRTRYAEIAKVPGEDQLTELVGRFRTRFAEDAALAEALAQFREALGGDPVLSEDGEVATYDLGGRFIKLSRMPDGRWGFHL